jgi:hypothetical protein
MVDATIEGLTPKNLHGGKTIPKRLYKAFLYHGYKFAPDETLYMSCV